VQEIARQFPLLPAGLLSYTKLAGLP